MGHTITLKIQHNKTAPQTTQWCNTLLAYCLPLPVLLRVWDVVFLDGWKALFRVCLALLQAVEADLLPLNLEDSGRYVSVRACDHRCR